MQFVKFGKLWSRGGGAVGDPTAITPENADAFLTSLGAAQAGTGTTWGETGQAATPLYAVAAGKAPLGYDAELGVFGPIVNPAGTNIALMDANAGDGRWTKTGCSSTPIASGLDGISDYRFSHDGTADGIFDLVGNEWEWSAGARTVGGEIQVIPASAGVHADHGVSSTDWKAMLADGTLVAPGTSNTLKYSTDSGIYLSTTQAGSSANTLFKDIGPGAIDPVPSALVAMGLFPWSSSVPTLGRFYIDTASERLPLRGGSWVNGANAGVASLLTIYLRGGTGTALGFRPAFVTNDNSIDPKSVSSAQGAISCHEVLESVYRTAATALGISTAVQDLAWAEATFGYDRLMIPQSPATSALAVCAIGGDPHTNINFDNSLTASQNLGATWTLMTQAMWHVVGVISQHYWTTTAGHEPYGNTAHGRSHADSDFFSIRTDGLAVDGTSKGSHGRTLTYGFVPKGTIITATSTNATALQAITSSSNPRVSKFWLERESGTGTIEITQDDGSTWAEVTLTDDPQPFDIAAATLADPDVGIRIGTDGDSVRLYGVQHQVADRPLRPYIGPTAGSTVTSGARTMIWTLSESPSLVSLKLLFRTPTVNVAGQTVFSVDNNAATNLIDLKANGSGGFVLRKVIASSETAFSAFAVATDTLVQVDVEISASVFRYRLDGGSWVNGTAGIPGSLSRFRTGHDNANAGQLGQPILALDEMSEAAMMDGLRGWNKEALA